MTTRQLEMRAARIHQFGGPEVLKIEKVDVPDPQADELLIRILASSVNPVDYKIRSGKHQIVAEDQLPITLGRDFAGVVELCGSPSFTLQQNDEVFGMPAFDRSTYAQYVVVRINEVAKKPASLELSTAGTLSVAVLTSWQALFDHGEMKPGQRVLIHGGSGGVGHLAVQIAKAKAWKW